MGAIFYVYFNVNFIKLIKVHLLVSELYIYQNARCNDKKKLPFQSLRYTKTLNLPFLEESYGIVCGCDTLLSLRY